jgi:hypothetical protein
MELIQWDCGSPCRSYSLCRTELSLIFFPYWRHRSFQEARPLVFADELNDRRGISRVVLLHRHGHRVETLRLNSGEVPF